MVFTKRLFERIINTIAVWSSGITYRTRSLMISISLFVLLWNGLVRYCNYHIRDLLHYEAGLNIGLIMLIVLLVASIDGEVHLDTTRPKRAFWCGWTVCFVMMLLMAFNKPVERNYLIWSIISIFIFPVLFYVWKQGSKHERICRTAAQITVALSYIFAGMSFVIVPFVSKADILPVSEYLGMAPNPNNNGILCTAFFAAALYLFFTEARRKPLCLISMGFSIAVSVISVSRAAELAIVLQLFAGIVYYLKGCRRGVYRRLPFRAVIASVIIVVITAFSCGCILKVIDDVDLNAHAATEETVEADDGQDSVVEIINDVSSGRVLIWSVYISKATMFGNGSPTEPVIEGYTASRWAHNNALDILYISGVIPFLGYVVWFASLLIFILKSVFDKSMIRKEYLFTIVVGMGYLVQAMLEITLFPTTTNISMLMYIGLVPVAFHSTCENTNQSA